MKDATMRNLGDRLLALRLIGAGAILVLLLWSVLMPPAGAQSLSSAARASAPLVAEPELPATDLLLRFESPALHFRWSLAPEAALEPELVRALRSEALAERTKAMREAEQEIANPPPGRGPIRSEWVERWQAEGETDALIALSSRLYTYTGGAHGNFGFRAMLWDRGNSRRIGFAELFTDPKAAFAALQPGFCKALDAERAMRRQGVRNAAFSDCPPLADLLVVPVGSGTITSVRVLVPPYTAGPWSEGAYEIALPVDPLRPLILPRYAAGFAKP